MQFTPFGDAAVLLQLEQRIDPAINETILSLHELIQVSDPLGYCYSIPAYSSLTIVYDPETTSYHDFRERLNQLCQAVPMKHSEGPTINIPVCYDPEFGLDLNNLSSAIDLSTKEITNLHLSRDYRVFMIGFLPGFTYLGMLPPSLECSRLDSPRMKVPAGSVGLAGLQTGIYPLESPGGWQIIGRTPISLFRPMSDQPFVIKAGDKVRFISINKREFHAIGEDFRKGSYQIHRHE